MNPRDINFPLRSGFSLTNEGLTAQEKEEIVALLYVFMENGLGHASEFVQASGRSVVTPKDVSFGLKMAALRDRFWEAEDLPDRQRNALDVIRSEDGEDELEDDDECSIVEEGEEVHEEWCTPAGSSLYNDVIEQWESWEPSNPIDVSVKRAVDVIDSSMY